LVDFDENTQKGIFLTLFVMSRLN